MRKALLASHQLRRPSSSSTSTLYETILNSIKETPTSISQLHQLHALIITSGFSSKSVLASRLISFYASLCGPEQAHNLFELLPKRTSHAYNYMLKAFTDRSQYRSVFALYSTLLSDEEVLPDPVTFSIVLKACIALRLERGGKVVHAHVLVTGSELDLRLVTDLLQLYLKCGFLDFAKKLFALMPQRDAFVWTAMIDGLLRLRSYDDALKFFRDMRDSGLKASNVTWNVLISGFARDGLYDDALHHMKLMQLDGMRPGDVTLSSILPMFAQNALLKPSLEVHAYVVRNGFESNLFIVSALVDMYAKCGKMSLARCLFDRAEVRDTGLWNSIIVGYGAHGNCKQAISLFDEMIDSGVRPSEITITAVLSACSHRGMISEGLRVFRLMVDDFNILARPEHYACMVDMLGRAGLLKEAYAFIRRMPTEPTKDIWGAFLGSCRIHSDVKFMEIAGKHMTESSKTSETTGYHVVMSNMYAENGQWGEVAKLRTQIRLRHGKMNKRTGHSWIEIGDAVHLFSMADFSHPQSADIYFLLRNLKVVISGVPESNSEEFSYQQMQI